MMRSKGSLPFKDYKINEGVGEGSTFALPRTP